MRLGLALFSVVEHRCTEARKSEDQRRKEEEDAILQAHLNQRKLASDRELAKGVSYAEPLTTRCVVSSSIRLLL